MTLLACTPWHKRENVVFDETVATETATELPTETHSDISNLRAVRWHLLRAIEEQALGLTQYSQQDLERAFRILADLDEHDARSPPPTFAAARDERHSCRAETHAPPPTERIVRPAREETGEPRGDTRSPRSDRRAPRARKHRRLDG